MTRVTILAITKKSKNDAWLLTDQFVGRQKQKDERDPASLALALPPATILVIARRGQNSIFCLNGSEVPFFPQRGFENSNGTLVEV